MTFFSRRRIQSMLDDLSYVLDVSKRQDLVKRLNNKDPEQTLGAEAELLVAWSFREFDLEIEPCWWLPPKCPDLYVEGLIEGTPLAIEVTAFADVGISGEDVMDHCAQALKEVANEEKNGIGEYLYFHFSETSENSSGGNKRGIAAAKPYLPSASTRTQISTWIKSNPSFGQRLKIEDLGVIVDIEKKEHRQIRYHNYHVSRPPRVYSDIQNPLYRRLTEKSSQLRDAPEGVLRIIIIVEAGSRFLADVINKDRRRGIESYSTANMIINRFVKEKKDTIDAVIILVPVTRFFPRSNRENVWETRYFFGTDHISEVLSSAIQLCPSGLPQPKFDGFNARSLTRQKAVNYNSRGWYLPPRFYMKNDQVTYRMPARAFLDFLGKKITEEQFRRFVAAEIEGPSIGHLLDQGFVIQRINFESGGIDEDDDYLVFDLSASVTASPYK